ncbi:immune inhibitor A domain-containing protein [Cellulomonas aerilata]|uniref:Protease n=1 Tax=Cellulomonas aerilata TaxID=515326 RepID=A0A512DET0_9CELL|nr:immune inhibitor A domain-containing protein [Cellulomonas aerilata]GEO34946.1 protease [Cellulomonas aerilata]
MRKTSTGLLMTLALAAGSGLLPSPASAVPAAPPEAQEHVGPGGDAPPDPIADKQQALREQALAAVLKGEATPERIGSSTVVKVGEAATAQSAESGLSRAQAAEEPVDQYVQLSREDTDQLFVLLVEFGNERHPDFPDRDTAPTIAGPAVFDGPLFNAIPEPDRAVDNSTDWHPDYDQDYYQDLYFGDGSVTGRESMRQYYEQQSSGRYSVEGLVTDVVKVPFNEARYGRSNGVPCAGNVCSNTWELVRDGMDAWYASQVAAGQTPEQIAETLADYDVWDRNDADGDGNFDEPDGYIDHLQIIHAGGDQADQDPQQGEDAIWSHRWRAFQVTKPNPEAPIPAIGGTPVGDTGIWAADYTIQPENGGLSVIAHEFGHDLNLPDLYDRVAPAGVDNPVNWWSLMAQSRVSAPEDDALGSRAADLGPWEKLQLGWLDYEIVAPGQKRTLELGPHEYNSDKPQAVAVVLPDKPVVTQLGAPATGERQWWSGNDDDYEATMTREVVLPDGPASLTFAARWNIEDCGADPCDYAFVEVDDGTGFKAIAGSITKAAEGNGIDGVQEEWVDATFDLSAYAGSTIGLRFRYSTDGAATGQDADLPAGIFIDDVVVTAGGTAIVTSGAEAGDTGWALDGFQAVGSSVTTLFDQFYLASNREYVGFDKYLQTGPYNARDPLRPDLFEHFPYQDGLLVWYWDTSVPDNDTTAHPGEGEILPVDAHPRVLFNLEGVPWRGRIQTYDATFGLQRADSFQLHVNGKRSLVRGQPAVRTFDDSDPERYFKPELPSNGVRVAGTGTRIRVQDEEGTSVRIRVEVPAAQGAGDQP